MGFNAGGKHGGRAVVQGWGCPLILIRLSLLLLSRRLDQANKRKAAAAAAAAPATLSLSKKAAASSQTFAAVRGKDWQVPFHLHANQNQSYKIEKEHADTVVIFFRLSRRRRKKRGKMSSGPSNREPSRTLYQRLIRAGAPAISTRCSE
jgi:hypothetical protein